MGLSVLIPYGGERQEWYADLVEYVVARWESDFPGAEIVMASGGKPFNRSAARNEAARRASGDVYVVCDADTTYCDTAWMRSSINEVLSDGDVAWIMPRSHVQATRTWTAKLLKGNAWFDEGISSERVGYSEPGGWRICTAAAFSAVGGFDEGFHGWGYEDTAFVLAMATIHGSERRQGDAIHLWHPKVRSQRQLGENFNGNRERFQLYAQAAAEGPDAMRQLLADLGVT